MLVLSRFKEESIILHGGPLPTPIEINILEIRRGKVRIGIEAPREIKVHRKEVIDKCRTEGTYLIDAEQ